MNALVFGEILFDVYNDTAVIGGASFNFAVQLSRLIREKNSVKMLSCVGNDDWGKQSIEFAKNENIDTSFIYTSEKYPTGKATVFLNEENKVPDYIIHEDVAWDHIPYTDKVKSAMSEEYDIFYCNILAQRADVSHSTLMEIFDKIKAKIRIFDITVRKKFYIKEKIEKTLHFINVFKLNDDELLVIRDLFYPSISTDDTEKLLTAIKKDFEIPYIFLTLGKKGAVMLSEDEGYIFKKSNDINVVDTVGAGDSFSAGVSYALRHCVNDKKVLDFGAAVSEQMIQVRGGTGKYDVLSVIDRILGKK